MDIEDILPRKGVIPPRPATLTKPEYRATQSSDVTVVELMENGKVAAYGGLSLIGEEGYIVCMVGLLQAKDGHIKGWTLAIGDPSQEKPDFNRIDTTIAPLTSLPFPNTMIYFACEADEKLIAVDISRDELLATARFILPFISDDGPPQGIDW